MKRIVVLGGGYGGILTAKHLEKNLRKENVKITLIDKNPYHTMLTELHEVAAGRVDEDSIKIYFNQVFAGRKIDFVMDEISSVDFTNQELVSEKAKYPYDYLVIGTGCKPTFFGNNAIKEHVFTLWSLEDAVLLREHIVEQFRKAAKMEKPGERKQALSFVVTGAGFTGVEMAGELAEYVPTLCHDYRVNREEVSIRLLDMAPRVLPTFPEKLSINAVKKLNGLGVQCFTGSACGNITDEGLTFGEDLIKSETIIWTTGVEGSSLVDNLSVEKQGRGRIACNKYLQAKDNKNVYVVGDNIFYVPEGEQRPVPQMVENAEQSSACAAHNIVCDIKGIDKKEEYKPAFHGAMVCIGGRKGLAQVGLPNMMFNIKNSFISLFIKHFINVLYFMQVLGWTKIWSYIKHEFFNVPHDRSMVGGVLSRKIPSIYAFPLRLWLGFAWFLQGLPKVINKLSGGWDNYCTLSELTTVNNNSPVCGVLGKSTNIVNSGTYTPKDPGLAITYTNYNGLDRVLAYINDFFAGFKPYSDSFGMQYNVSAIFHYYEQNFKWIGWLFYVLEWAYNLFMTISDWFMNTIISWIAPLFEFILAFGELAVGILLILGLFTTLAATGSVVLSIMVIVGTLFTYNGIFLSELVWYLVGSIVLLNIGGSGSVLSLDYYVMPKIHGFLQKIPFIKRWYLYGEKVDF